MTPDRAALAQRFARRWGSFSAPDESYSVALRSVWLAERTWRDGAGCAFSTWAAWYARTRLLRLRRAEAMRASRSKPFNDEIMAPAEEPTPPADMREVRAAVHRLPARQRQAVELLFFEGLTQVEAAAQLGTTRQAVAKLSQKGIEKLRRVLKAPGAAPF